MAANEIIYHSAAEHAKALAEKKYSAVELAQASLERADAVKNLGIFLEIDQKRILDAARSSDDRRAKNAARGPLDGIPVALKDNILVNGSLTTCASKMLADFRAPYSATVVEKLESAGAVLFGRANMDEFAMGSSTENSAFQVTRNPWNPAKVPGGSSGGSAAAVAASVVPLSLGSDTGGSIRQPAALCGIYGLKPTYGTVSRFGLVAFASSLDQIGPFARTVDDAALLLNAIAGHDTRDSTSIPGVKVPTMPADGSVKGLRIGLSIPRPGEAGFDPAVVAACETARRELEKAGAKIVPIQSKLWEYGIPIYYILATAEASSNLSRYDGVRYGHRSKAAEDVLHLYVRSRTEGFGPEVKRRILLGTYVLSSGYYDAYYRSAEKARIMIKREYEEFFRSVDVILQPTTPTTAFGLGEKTKDPIAMYQSDLLTIAVNLGGVPSMSVPAGRDDGGLPIGLQLTAAPLGEANIYRAAKFLSHVQHFVPDYRDVQIGKSLESTTEYSKKISRHNIGTSSEYTKDKVNISAPVADTEVKATKAGSGSEREKTKVKLQTISKVSAKKAGQSVSKTPVKKQPEEGENPMMKKKTAKKKTAKKKSAKKKSSKRSKR